MAGRLHDGDVLGPDLPQVVGQPLGRAADIAGAGRVAAQAGDTQQRIELVDESISVVT